MAFPKLPDNMPVIKLNIDIISVSSSFPFNGSESQFFDKDTTVCPESSFCSDVTFRQNRGRVVS